MSNNIRNQPMYCQSGNFETENVAVDAYPGTLGSRVTVNTPTGATGKAGVGGKTYQRVLTDSGMAVAPFSGAVAWWADKSKSMVTTDPTKLGRGRVAGIFRNAITPGNIGFVQVEGTGNVFFVDTPTAAPSAAGLLVIPSATAGKADCLAAGSAATYPIIGETAGAVIGGSGQAPVEIAIPDTP